MRGFKATDLSMTWEVALIANRILLGNCKKHFYAISKSILPC